MMGKSDLRIGLIGRNAFRYTVDQFHLMPCVRYCFRGTVGCMHAIFGIAQ